MTLALRNPPPAESWHPEGEFLAINERLVVCPAWEAFHRESLEEGSHVSEGSILGRVKEGAREALVLSPIQGVLLAWLVWEGERVPPGRPVVRLGLAEATSF